MVMEKKIGPYKLDYVVVAFRKRDTPHEGGGLISYRLPYSRLKIMLSMFNNHP